MTSKSYKMPLSIKRAIALELDAHKRGDLKRMLIAVNVIEMQYKNRRRSVVEKEPTE